jgi:hypothetical protein
MVRSSVVLVAVALVGAASARSASAPPPARALVQVASTLAGVQPRVAPRVVVLPPAALRAQAVRSLDRRFPPAQLAFETQLYRGLGLLGPAQALRPLVQAAWLPTAGPVVSGNTVYVGGGAAGRSAALLGLVELLYQQRYHVPQGAADDADRTLALVGTLSGTAELALRGLRPAAAAPPAASGRAAAFVRLEAQASSAFGLRLATNLFNVGGDGVVRELLAEPPVSTEQLLHVDRYLNRDRPLPVELPATAAGFTLVRDDTFGELALRALLAVYEVPHLAAATAGWGAGVAAVYRGDGGAQAVALRVDGDSPLDASEWATAAAAYVAAAFAPAVSSPCSVASCWTAADRAIAFAADGARTALVVGPTGASAADLAAALVQ